MNKVIQLASAIPLKCISEVPPWDCSYKIKSNGLSFMATGRSFASSKICKCKGCSFASAKTGRSNAAYFSKKY